MVAKATLKHFTVAERFSKGDARRSGSIDNYQFLAMDFTRRRLRRLNDQIFEFIEESCPEEDLEKAWKVMQSLYYDLYMLRAIREAKEAVQPGDTMLYEEALRVYRSL